MHKKKGEVEDFIKILEEKLPIFVTKPATECQLQNKGENSGCCLTPQKFSPVAKIWKELASTCLIVIQIFNRKRAGEVKRIEAEDFKTFHSIDSGKVGDLIQKEYVANNKKYVRFLKRACSIIQGITRILPDDSTF